MIKPTEFIIHIDGACSGNPGDAAIGIMLHDVKHIYQETISKFIGTATNNIAEYAALIEALKRAKTLEAKKVYIKSDSELLVKQLKGEYKVKNEQLQGLFREVIILIRQFSFFDVRHIKREHNKEADKLAKRAIKEYQRANRMVAAQENTV